MRYRVTVATIDITTTKSTATPPISYKNPLKLVKAQKKTVKQYLKLSKRKTINNYSINE